MSNPVKDKNGIAIKEGDKVKYYDSTTMWLESKVVDVGGALAVETGENPILLYEFAARHTNDAYIYNGTPIPEIEVINEIPS